MNAFFLRHKRRRCMLAAACTKLVLRSVFRPARWTEFRVLIVNKSFRLS